MSTLKGRKFVAFLSILVGGIGLAVYPIIIDPMINTDKYKKIQEQTRAGVDQELIQPGGMKVWSDPFGRK